MKYVFSPKRLDTLLKILHRQTPANVPKEGLLTGDVGVVVHILPNGRAYEVEFLTLAGTTIAVATIPAERVRPITESDVSHARTLAAF